jgi:hypothetical protein
MVFGLLASLAAGLAAQAQESPYAGLESRRVKALADDRIAGYLAGEGMGYAMAAELNGYPGPKHVLELATELGLSPEQVTAVTAIFDRMHQAAVALGEQVVAAEEALDTALAEGTISAERLAELVRAGADLEGALRVAHLAAHLETRALLSPHQVHQYTALRGYEEMDHSRMQHGQHGQ